MNNIILGAWQVGSPAWTTVDTWRAYETLFMAIDRGFDRIDTAPSYGDGRSESIVGEVVRHFSGKDIKVISKVPPDMLSKKKLVESVEGSLSRLGVSQLDTLLIHWPTGTMGTEYVPIEQTLEALLFAKTSGLTKKIGICNYPLEDLGLIDSIVHLDCVQYAYSLLFRGIEFGIHKFAINHGQEIMGYSPLAQGILTSRETVTDYASGDHRNNVILFHAKYRSKINSMLERLQGLLPPGVDLSSLSLSWVRSKGVTPIVGLHRPAHLHSILSDPVLDEALFSQAEAICEEFKSDLGGRISLW